MSAPFRRIAVVGLGLLGGSVARAARERGLARTVVGTGRRSAALAEAVEQGVIDAACSVPEALGGADLVVLATPVGVMGDLLRTAADALEPGALVTDVGSVKGPLAETLPGLLPEGVTWIGSHPMAGSHRRGVEHARADLFEGAPCVVTAGPEASAAARERIEAFWGDLGARVVRRNAVAHDEEVAWTSHVPHLLAFAFAAALRDAPEGADEVVGGGFRDFTRIAHSEPELWAEILCANRKALAGPLQRVADELAGLARTLESGDPDAVERALAAARESLGRFAADEQVPDPGASIPEISPPRAGTPRSDSNES